MTSYPKFWLSTPRLLSIIRIWLYAAWADAESHYSFAQQCRISLCVLLSIIRVSSCVSAFDQSKLKVCKYIEPVQTSWFWADAWQYEVSKAFYMQRSFLCWRPSNWALASGLSPLFSFIVQVSQQRSMTAISQKKASSHSLVFTKNTRKRDR
jgi:hypothetical protein